MMRSWPAAFVLVSLVGCSGTLPEPRFADDEHRGEEPQVVLSMPPPGKVEIVPPRPPGMKHPVWIDGEWVWSGNRRWVWQEHGWEEDRPGQSYELPVTKRLPDGKLVHFPGQWQKPEATPPR
jgi:hypothetical protein